MGINNQQNNDHQIDLIIVDVDRELLLLIVAESTATIAGKLQAVVTLIQKEVYQVVPCIRGFNSSTKHGIVQQYFGKTAARLMSREKSYWEMFILPVILLPGQEGASISCLLIPMKSIKD